MIVGKRCDEPELWNEIVHDLDGHPLQLWGWGELKAAHNWSAHRVIFVDHDDVVVGAAQILSRKLPGPLKRLNYVARGPVWCDGKEEAVLDALAHYTKQHLPGVVLSIEPDDEEIPPAEGWRTSPNHILIPRTLILDLNKGEPTLLEAMSKKTRQYIRKSEREGLVFRQVHTAHELAQCLEIYRQTASRAGFPLHKDQYYQDVHRFLGDSSIIFAAFSDHAPVAFVWLAVSEKTAFELYGGMNDKGQELRANYALKWHAIRKCKEWGIDRYDMNGLLNDGVSTFKQGFADHEDMLAGTYDYPLSPLYTTWSKGLPTAKKTIRRVKKILRR
ncbi:peptidoglycan bridge formation glycyltransferase FemA/FemB family protein [Patescibacteria group bacterium]|nr:peptidoglycan bridge formation glycyltransferase FemA/FemB family protein [Patescibacteria group bacterium]